MQWLLVYAKSCTIITVIYFSNISIKRNPVPISSQSIPTLVILPLPDPGHP